MTRRAAPIASISRLARLRLAPDEAEALAADLDTMLAYVRQLQDVPTDDVAPLGHPLPGADVFDEDVPVPSPGREVMLANAPARDSECFRVPPVL